VPQRRRIHRRLERLDLDLRLDSTTSRDADFTGTIFVLLTDPPDSRDANTALFAPTTRASADVRGVENVALEPHRSLKG
jgi:hypothetical protein